MYYSLSGDDIFVFQQGWTLKVCGCLCVRYVILKCKYYDCQSQLKALVADRNKANNGHRNRERHTNTSGPVPTSEEHFIINQNRGLGRWVGLGW